MRLVLDGRSLSLRKAMQAADGLARVEASPAAIKKMKHIRSLLEHKLARGEAVYGVNTGFGSLSDKAVRLGNLMELQINLIRSHAAGVGHPLPKEVVRAAMVIRLNSILNGNSATRKEIADLLIELLNRDVTPYIPEFGSLGASGDLVPSAHMALTMVGEGRAYYEGELLDSSKALSAAKLKPVVLHAKEGLSLINGTAFTTGFGCVAAHRASSLLQAANSVVALTGQVLGACSQSFNERLVGLKRDPGQAAVAKNVRAIWRGSLRIRDDPVPQDAYSIRCVPQVHGSLNDALGFVERLVVNEMNSVSDNPVLLEDGAVLHGGNFHAQPVAMGLDFLALALSYLGVISLSRINLLLSRTPPETKYMAGKPGLESGLMILQYTATALAADNARQVYPQSAYPANVSGGVEDHASHGVNAGIKALEVTENISQILAIEMICASNVLGSDQGGISARTRSLCKTIRSVSPLLKGDRSQSEEIEALSKLVLAGKAA